MLQHIKLDVLYSSNVFEWDHIRVDMVPRGHWSQKNIDLLWKSYKDNSETDKVEDKVNNTVKCYSNKFNQNQILDANYSVANFIEIAENQAHLSPEERNRLLEVLQKHKAAFQGTRGKWKGPPMSFEMVDGAKPFHAKPFRIPQSLYDTLKKEINRLVDEGVLSPVKSSEWACPTFGIPKKDKTIRVVLDFRGINKLIKRKPYPVLLIQDIMPVIGKFQYATAIDLVMGHYSMGLALDAKEKCVICLPWGLYRYQVLPMGLIVSSDVFQEAMGNLMLDLENVYCYLDDIIVIGNSSFEDHMTQVDEVLGRLREKRMQVHLGKLA